jgi:methylated-DNA-[protein]-cysteine S-methyltransferase
MSKQISDYRDLERALRAPADGDAGARAAQRAASRAAQQGLADVTYASVDSPIGPLLVAATRRGLVRVSFDQERHEDVLNELVVRISPRVLEAPTQLDEVRRELEQYFEGERREFELPLDWRLSRGFRCEVLRKLVRVPYGETATYAEMAIRAGRPRAYRAAGSACGSNPMPIVVPCHRVVPSGGGLGNYGGGVDMKKYLLELEGAIG